MKTFITLALLWTCLATDHALAAPPIAPADWPQYNYDNRGWRFNVAEKALAPDTVGKLVEKWRFPPRDSKETIGAVHATPVVVNGFTYVGTAVPGVMYKLSPRGKEVWRFDIPRSPHYVKYQDAKGRSRFFGESWLASWLTTNSALVTERFVFFTTGDGQIFCLDRFAGKRLWSVDTRADTFPGYHLLNSFWSSPIIAEGKLIVGGGALEQGGPSTIPDYQCCSGRGFVAAFDPERGSLLWKYDLGTAPEPFDPPLVVERNGVKVTYKYGPSTSTVWSTPTYDPATRTLFFGTDTNNSPRRPTHDDRREYTPYSCAIVAIDAQVGREKWFSQLVKNDVWYGGNPDWDPKTGDYKDVSIGDSPKLYEIADAGRPRPVIGVGCKNGGYYLLDRQSGQLIANTPLYLGPPEPDRIADRTTGILALPSALGGLQTGCAFDGERAYCNGLDWLGNVKDSLEGGVWRHPPAGGRVTAIRPNTLGEFWRHERPQLMLPRRDQPGRKLLSGDPVGSGIAVANGVAFFTTTMTKKLIALDAQTGAVLLQKTLEPVWSGPSVSRGRVFVGAGSIFWKFGPDDFAEPPAFDFPTDERGAVYSFGLPGEDELDRLPELETL